MDAPRAFTGDETGAEAIKFYLIFYTRSAGRPGDVAGSRPDPVDFVGMTTPPGAPDPSASDKRKQSLYFPEQMLKEIQEEAARQDRSLSWIVQKAWKIARRDILKYPSISDPANDGTES